MAALDNIRSAGSVALNGGRVARFFAGIVAAVAAWNDARVTRNALAKLSDRELDDIGLCRADIDQIIARR